MVNMDEVNAIAQKKSLAVLEDCAQSHGAEFNGKKAGSLSTLAAFSFYPTKVLGGYGDGGMVVTNDETLYKKLLRLRFYGMEKTYYAHEHGYNSRLDELHAAILLKKLDHLEAYIARRREIAGRYDILLSGTPFVLPHRDERCRHVFYLYVCRHAKRDEIIATLAEAKIFLNISYPWPVHTMDAYRYLGCAEGSFPHTEAAAKEIFSLPMYPTLGEDEQLRVIELLKVCCNV
jgi:aminotransferase EvaB